MALTVAWVPTGMKIGVEIVPWGVEMVPSRAAHDTSFATRLKVNDCKQYLLSKLVSRTSQDGNHGKNVVLSVING
jgi:hypothetical protein